jgi:GNAT superfamily N-acetyltransferase
VDVVALTDDRRDWAAALLLDRWGGIESVSRGRLLRADLLPGFVALAGSEAVGLATYKIDGDQCELVTIDSLAPGAGTGLLSAVAAAARQAGCRRLWLITTNDNVDALRFYQRRGFVLVAVHRDAMAQSRRIKPSIPLVGMHGIPLRDEIELELALS